MSDYDQEKTATIVDALASRGVRVVVAKPDECATVVLGGARATFVAETGAASDMDVRSLSLPGLIGGAGPGEPAVPRGERRRWVDRHRITGASVYYDDLFLVKELPFNVYSYDLGVDPRLGRFYFCGLIVVASSGPGFSELEAEGARQALDAVRGLSRPKPVWVLKAEEEERAARLSAPPGEPAWVFNLRAEQARKRRRS